MCPERKLIDTNMIQITAGALILINRAEGCSGMVALSTSRLVTATRAQHASPVEAYSITTNVRTSMLSLAGLSAVWVGSGKALCGVNCARPSSRLSQPLISSTSSLVISGT